MTRIYLCCIGCVLSIISLILLIVTFVMGVFTKAAGSVGKQFWYNNLIAIDQLFNAHFLGDPDETISSRQGKRHPNRWFTKFINWLFSDPNHCTTFIEKDEGANSVRTK